jgi:hypothetical protein
VLIEIKDPRALVKYRQGSRSADFLVCGNCGVLVAVLYTKGKRLYATINARAVDASASFGEVQSVSPKEMSATDKAERWRALWFADAKIVGVDS